MNTDVVQMRTESGSDQRLRIALDAMPVAVVWSRLDDGQVEYMNQRFLDMFGFTLADHGSVYELIHAMFFDQNKAEAAASALRSAVNARVLDPFQFPTEELLTVHADGTTIFTSFSGIVVPEANMSLATFVDISDLKARESALKQMAEEDPLTGLHNRRAFDLALTAAVTKRGEQTLALAVLDLDGFKKVNDEWGHAAGDELLRHVGRNLVASFRKSDVMARWGGDEFAVLLQPPVSHAEAHAALQRLERALAQPASILGNEVQVRYSLGLAFYPDDAANIAELYQLADEAMYRDKKARREQMQGPSGT